MSEINVIDIADVEQNIHKVIFDNGYELYLIGTAHVSVKSADLVESKIIDIKPDVVCLELDKQRFYAIKSPNKNKNISILKIIKNGQFFFFVVQLIMASFQKKLSRETDSMPGDEFRRAINVAEKNQIRIALIDRNIGITLKRAWRVTPLKDKIKLLSGLLFYKKNVFEKIEIEKMKSDDSVTFLVNSFSEELPETKKVLIDERDIYLAYGIKNNLEQRTIAVVGAGHIPGILKNLQQDISSGQISNLEIIPGSKT